MRTMLLLSMLLCAACGAAGASADAGVDAGLVDSGTTDGPLTWAPTTLDFGSVTSASSLERDITFSNPSSQAVQLTVLTASPASFVVRSTGSADLTTVAVPAAVGSTPGTAVVRVAFTPSAMGTVNGQLTAHSTVAQQPIIQVALKGIGG